ncbi:GRIP and coiled-coil domain-containing protein-like isoform X9 [Dreissena polymorpha]|uniref:GRIP and coiled-coil domain-containing protein-like isoform X2 n=1 Tax=Dreissena polymorpha TaxID=45954 RepID=UPI002264A774|nr:GRIP and coiled-coil domain-containing protein-like isoform X2 [Dreissena polymorpha]XP_052226307.1 GRIP and coiled-coil domain-containing protein-like isoform X8 [Dreissena polymorpha]XP_052226308.1 GRIP and coiled-coil domain-containing protein-like isoform X9 [Dreissena polymorpha]
MGKSGCLPPGSCRWLVQFKKSMNARVAKFKNDFRRKFFRDNKHLGQLRADQLHNETGTRDMEITKKTSKTAADSTVPKKKVVKQSTYGYQPSLYAEEASSEIRRTQVVKNSNDENSRNSSPHCRDSSQVTNKAVVHEPTPTRSKEEELDEFVNTVIRNSVAHLIKEASVTYLMKESEENLLKRHDSNVETTGEQVIKETDTTNKNVVIDTDTTNENVVINTDTTNECVVIDTDTTNERVVIDTDTNNERVVIDTDTTNEQVVIDTDTTNDNVVIDTNTTNERVVIDTDTTNERVVVDTDTINEYVFIDTDNTNEQVVIDTDTTNERVVIDTDTTNQHVVIESDTTNERVVVDTDTTNKYVVIDTDNTNQHVVINSNTTNERVVVDTDTTNEYVVIDTDTTNERVVIDTDTTNERVVMDTDNTKERVVIDIDTIKESNAMNVIKASSEIVLKEQVDNYDITYGQIVKETDSVSVSSSVLSAFAESAVKASLFELDVVDNVNHSAMVPTSAVKARRSPRTVKEFLEMIGVPDCRDSSSLHLPDVDI